MEPFGLFHFLSAMLNQTQNQVQSPTENSANPTPPAPAAPPPVLDEKREEITLPPTNYSSENSPPNAFLDFLATHDARAKRTKPKR